MRGDAAVTRRRVPGRRPAPSYVPGLAARRPLSGAGPWRCPSCSRVAYELTQIGGRWVCAADRERAAAERVR